ncbi:heavy metal translocating P-type ATPase, partial [Bacteroidota bacterium]
MSESSTCVHCGDDCGKYPVLKNGLTFCCHGCETVYYLLNDNKLYSYYEIEKNPGIKIDQHEIEHKYAFLDHEEIKNKLIEFTDGETSKITFYIPAIHCSSCIWLLENLNRLDKNILQSMVNFPKKEVTITFYQNGIRLRGIAELLTSIHYIPQITLDQTDQKKSSKTNRQLITKIGIAGFAFGNIMLLSMPSYLPGKELIEEPFRNFFSWISLILSLPVLIYCSSDYLLSAYKNLKQKQIVIDLPIAIGILALFIQSSAEIIWQTGSGYLDSLSGLVFFLLIGKWYQNKTYEALSFERDYKSYFPVAVTKIINGKEETSQLKDLKAGDHILIRNQELIPADAVLRDGTAFIDYSFITGESRPGHYKPGQQLYAGGRQVGSTLLLEITAEVEQSRLTKLWNQENKTQKEKSNLILLIDKVSQYFTVVVISIAVITAIIWLFINPADAIQAATSVLIIACPCALALSVPFTFGNMMRYWGKSKFYLKKTDIIERLTKINTIVFDKTGTITKHGSEKVKFVGRTLNDEEKLIIFSLVKHSTHPLSNSISKFLWQNRSYPVDKFIEQPAEGLKGYVKEIFIKIGSDKFVNSNDSLTNSEHPSSKIFVNFNNEKMGYFQVENEYRENLNEVIKSLKESYELHVISGDNDSERENLQAYFKTAENIHFNVTPENKLNYIKKLKDEGKNVLMIGDGLNDAGALSESDTGISIADNVFLFSPACDAILDSSEFGHLADFLRMSQKTVGIVKISFLISFLYNSIGLFFATQALLS